MNITPEHVLYCDGVVSLVGFSKALVLNGAPLEYVGSSPDICGSINTKLFQFDGPSGSGFEDMGRSTATGYCEISRFLSGGSK